MTKWKKYGLNQVEATTESKKRDLTAGNEDFNNYVERAREVNTKRCYKYFLGNRKSNIWRAWLNVIAQLKLTKAKAAEFATRQILFRRRFAIKHWKARVHRTKQCRHRENQLVINYQLKYHKAAFNALKSRYLITKRLANALSTYERTIWQRMGNETFKNLRTFASSKKDLTGDRRKKGTEDLLALVKQAYLKRL